MASIEDAFEDVDMITTPRVASLLGITQARARQFADGNDVARVGNSFGWSKADVEALADELAEEDEDEEADDEDDDADDQDEEE